MTLNPQNVNITTAGDHQFTAAELLAGYVTRSGTPEAFTDTLPATSELIAAIGSLTPFVVHYSNTTTYQGTLAAADSKTTVEYSAGMLGATTINAYWIVPILITPNPDGTVTALLLYPYYNANN